MASAHIHFFTKNSFWFTHPLIWKLTNPKNYSHFFASSSHHEAVFENFHCLALELIRVSFWMPLHPCFLSVFYMISLRLNTHKSKDLFVWTYIIGLNYLRVTAFFVLVSEKKISKKNFWVQSDNANIKDDKKFVYTQLLY